MEKFFHYGDAISNVFVLVCGSLGGLFYAFNKHLPYGCFLMFYLLASIFAIVSLRDFEIVASDRKERFNFLISNLRETKTLIPLASIIFLAQFLMQPLFHYWQPLFVEQFSIESKEMSIVFITYSLAMSSISWGYSRITQFSGVRTSVFVLSAAIIGGFFYSLVGRSNTFVFALISFALSFGFFNLVQIAASVLIQNKLKHSNRMIITKYVSFYSRMGMVMSLLLLHWMFAIGWTPISVYKLYGLTALCAFITYLGLILVQKNGEKKYIS